MDFTTCVVYSLVYVVAPQLSFSHKCNSFRELIIVPQCSTLLYILMAYQLSSDESKEQHILTVLTPQHVTLQDVIICGDHIPQTLTSACSVRISPFIDSNLVRCHSTMFSFI